MKSIDFDLCIDIAWVHIKCVTFCLGNMKKVDLHTENGNEFSRKRYTDRENYFRLCVYPQTNCDVKGVCINSNL